VSEANVFVKPTEYEKQTDFNFSLLLLSAHLLTAFTRSEKLPYRACPFAAADFL
jgi:hypothetical protein